MLVLGDIKSRLEDEILQDNYDCHDTFAALVTRYRDMVYRIAYHYLRSVDDAQDAAQDVFVQVYLNINNLKDAKKIIPWLVRIAANTSISMVRKRRRLLSANEDLAYTYSGNCSVHNIDNQIVIDEALNKLPDDSRLTLVLHYLCGYSHDEIAQQYNIPINTVRSRLQRAKRIMREEISSMNEIETPQPSQEWTKQVVDEAIRRGKEAMERYAMGEAARFFDQALTELPDNGSIDQKRRRIDALWRKSKAIQQISGGIPKKRELLLEAFKLAEDINDGQLIADIYFDLACSFHDKEHMNKALSYFEALHDIKKQAQCLTMLGQINIVDDKHDEARTYISRAVSMFDPNEYSYELSSCRASLRIIDELRDRTINSLLLWSAGIVELLVADSSIEFSPGSGFCFMLTKKQDKEKVWWPFLGEIITSAVCINTILNTEMNTGDKISRNILSFSNYPLYGQLTVIGNDGIVTSPAGYFQCCRIHEIVIKSENKINDEDKTAHINNQGLFCGTHRFWFAPGVGIVQVERCMESGEHVVMQLASYHVAQSESYLPLAVGNQWSYIWISAPDDYITRETYHVDSYNGNKWLLGKHSYIYNYSI